MRISLKEKFVTGVLVVLAVRDRLGERSERRENTLIFLGSVFSYR